MSRWKGDAATRSAATSAPTSVKHLSVIGPTCRTRSRAGRRRRRAPPGRSRSARSAPARRRRCPSGSRAPRSSGRGRRRRRALRGSRPCRAARSRTDQGRSAHPARAASNQGVSLAVLRTVAVRKRARSPRPRIPLVRRDHSIVLDVPEQTGHAANLQHAGVGGWDNCPRFPRGFDYDWLKKPFSISRARSSADTSDVAKASGGRPCRRSAASAVERVCSPEAKSIRRLARSVSVPWRFRITGIASLNWSAICWASLKLLGMTRWTSMSPRGHWRRPVAAGASRGPGRAARRQRCRRSRRGAGAQPAHVGPVAIAILELYLGLGLTNRLVARILLLGEAEVDQRAMPGVTKRHAAVLFSRVSGKLLVTAHRSARLAYLCRDKLRVSVVGRVARSSTRPANDMSGERHT